jgi:hypothetical protein
MQFPRKHPCLWWIASPRDAGLAGRDPEGELITVQHSTV